MRLQGGKILKGRLELFEIWQYCGGAWTRLEKMINCYKEYGHYLILNDWKSWWSMENWTNWKKIDIVWCLMRESMRSMDENGKYLIIVGCLKIKDEIGWN